MTQNGLAEFVHLMRRAAFGATQEELQDCAGRGYEAVVEDLLHPQRFPEVEVDLLDRYFEGAMFAIGIGQWFYRMVNSKRQLQEKMALFWHHVFATAKSKVENRTAADNQIEMFRRIGLSDMRTILTGLSKDPAMIFYLDNIENVEGEPNENYGRELLELFSMGVGNYSEEDIKMVARAFTGWSFTQPIPYNNHGYYPTHFVFRQDVHDYGEKTFLGETGRLNGEDIIDIIVKQPATARFIARHLYNFFVADEPPVSAWSIEPPQDPEAIDSLVKAYFDSGGELRSMLRVLFNSDFFKDARSRKVKSPVELVAGVIKLVGTFRDPDPDIKEYSGVTTVMGQALMNPPSVEGWHTGKEWIDGGTISERVNFAVNEVSDTSKPGIAGIIERIAAEDGPISPADFVDRCLELVGHLAVSEQTRGALVRSAESGGELSFGTEQEREQAAARIVLMLQLMVSTTEYQFA